MNKQERDIMKSLLNEPFINQRILAEISGHSLGIVNRSIKEMIKEGYLDEELRPTEKAIQEVEEKSPKNAIILAAGFGMRMVPINTETPKGLIAVNGEPLIERLIGQLHQAGIEKIFVVVGFMKEQFEYLIDEYGVELVVNPDYAEKNNLHSLNLVREQIYNSYIIPCDIWCDRNPFSRQELYSWYMVSDLVDNESDVRVNRKMELAAVPGRLGGNAMLGICYLTGKEAAAVRENLKIMSGNVRYNHSFWEETLYQKEKMIVYARVVPSAQFVEINTYEQLRELDESSRQLKTKAMDIISKTFHTSSSQIVNIEVLKKGMTNRSFLFDYEGQKYIMRIPGEGTEQLINRRQEAAVYENLKGSGICDEILYINPDNGYKITRYLENARCCDPSNNEEVKKCMGLLRDFHERELEVDHEFDLFAQIDFYENLWGGTPSVYKDYEKTKQHVLELKEYIDPYVDKKVMTHIDAVPDNFLFAKGEEGGERIYLIDWEYAGMQDPHVDIAMFCIYSFYDREQIDRVIDFYFSGKCDEAVRIKIYCYVAVCGLLWSNWCEYKRNLGVEFGEYSLKQYRYAKDFYKLVKDQSRKKM